MTPTLHPSVPALLCALCVSAVPAQAQNATPDWFKKLDRNGDGHISREEMPKLFDQFDADRDGIGTVAELTAYYEKAQAAQKQKAAVASASVTLPDKVEKRPVTIWSDGTRMAGDLYLPKNRAEGEKLPAIVLCAGTGGTKGGTQARIAPIFAENGYIVLAFDYRGWGESDPKLMALEKVPAPDENGEVTVKARAVRWQMDFADQTEDIRAAISFVAGEPGVDKDRIGLWGSSYGGGLVTYMAGNDPRVKCTAAQVGGPGAPRTPQAEARLYDHLTKQAREETEPVPFETGNMTGKMERYTHMRVNPSKSIGFSTAEAAEKITKPILFVVAENEELGNIANTERAAATIRERGVPTKYHVIKGISHYGIYREGFEEATRTELAWFDEHLKGAAAKAVAPEPEAAPAPKPTAAAKPVTSDADLAFFEKNVRPVLIKSCYECHSAEADKLKAGLALDARAALLMGGDSGAAVVPGKPEESLLIASLRYEDPDLQMPPEQHGGKLSDAVIANFVEWVKRGAPMPEGEAVAVARKMEARIDHWAFKPVKDSPAPAVKDASWPRTEVDRFVLAELEKNGLAPVAEAEPAALLRRVHLDLTGLPPTAEEVQAFLADPTRESLVHTIDGLLESPHFGGRWGRHWLDVARYAESSGKETDFAYPQAWRYRDYVIASFNEDKPFDRFIREQIAGDLLEAADEKERAGLLIATGFLAIGPKSHIEKNPLQFEMDVVDEQIDTVSQAFLGMTMACARCHDNKYDPVSQRDYYALAGIFRSTDTKFGTVKLIQNNNPGALVPLSEAAGQLDALKPLTPGERDRLEKNIARDSARLAELTKEKMFASSEFVRTRIRLATDKAHLDAYEADGTPKQFVTCVLEREKPRDSALLLRGEVQKPGDLVPRGLPMLADGGSHIDSGSGRKELAEWIASPYNPLTSRVLVNRVWLHLFGQGLVVTPDNFGLSGQAPTHPALLDHLAARFVKEGWSVKKLIRELMTSRVYALSTAHDAKNYDADPDNTLLWRMTPRRLDAESIRDAMLLTAGKLDLTPPTGSAVAIYGEGYVTGVQTVVRGPLDQISPHRSVYLPVMRNLPLESLALFDMTSGSIVTGQRPQTTVPAQSLYLLNSPYVLKAAGFAAQRLLTDRPKSEPHRVKLAYERIFNRPPTDAEIEAALKFVKTNPDATQGWAALCQSLWASHEFLARG